MCEQYPLELLNIRYTRVLSNIYVRNNLMTKLLIDMESEYGNISDAEYQLKKIIQNDIGSQYSNDDFQKLTSEAHIDGTVLVNRFYRKSD